MPYIVRQCVEEVEKRGIEEVGIYRISGVATDIQALKAVFDASECGGRRQAAGAERAGEPRLSLQSVVWAGPFLSPCAQAPPALPLPMASGKGLRLGEVKTPVQACPASRFRA